MPTDGASAFPEAELHIVEVAADGVAFPRAAARLRRFCSDALREAGFSSWNVSLLLCDDQRMTELNRRYRHKAGPTDVLSFPEEDRRRGDPVTGDVAISLDTMARNAARFGVSENDEMKRLLVHGLLHLAGMDHGRGKGREMLSLQEKLLERLRVAQVYGKK